MTNKSLSMKKVLIACVLAIVVVFFVSISVASSGRADPKKSCDNRCMEEKALLGDGEIAYKIGNRFLYTDREKMKMWYRISAENGSVNGQHNYAHFLASDSSDASDCYRAIFWFSKAAAQGDKVSKQYRDKLVDRMPRNSGYKNGCSREYER